MFGWEFPPHISGGLGTACFGITKGLIQNNVEVIFVVPRVLGDEQDKNIKMISANDIPVHIKTLSHDVITQKFTMWGINSEIVPYLSVEEFEQYSEEKQFYQINKSSSEYTTRFEFTGKYGKDLLTEVWKYGIVAGEIAKQNEFDVIHAHDWLSFPAGMIAKEISGKPLIAHVHATEYDRSGENVNQNVRDIEFKGMLAADKVLTVSNFTRQILIHKYGIDPAKIEVVYNGIEDNKEPVESQKKFTEKIVSYLGRVTFQKGPEYFIEAASKVLKKDKGYRFVMAGTGDMLNRMIKRVAELRISSHFHFTGFLKGKDVDTMFAMSDVYVMPSVSEPFGISPLEALKSNVPVIISKQSGVQEVLKHAVKVDFWDTDRLANAIYALTTFKGLAKISVRESREEMKNLKWELQAEKIKQLYQQLLNRG